MNKQLFKPLLACAGVVTAIFNSPVISAADSLKTKWATNGHYYKRYDNATTTWTDGQTACKNLGAHLATITSDGEQAFVYSLVSGSPIKGWFAMGASDAAVEGAWQWVTGEGKDGWTYSNWYSGEPNGGSSENYMYFEFSSYSGNSKWFNGGNGTTNGYVCEWSTNNYIATAEVPDQNGNGRPEDAILYVDFASSYHTVVLRDRQGPVHAKVGISLTFAKNDIPPKGLAVIADTNGNGKPEIGVLDVNYSTNVLVVRIKDVSDNSVYLRTLNFFTTGTHVPVSLSVGPDSNGNGAYELTVMATNKDTGKAFSETRDSKTGALLNSNAY